MALLYNSALKLAFFKSRNCKVFLVVFTVMLLIDCTYAQCKADLFILSLNYGLALK